MSDQPGATLTEDPAATDPLDITLQAQAPAFGVPTLGLIEPGTGPSFKVSEVGEVFFNRTSFWVRWLEKNNRHVLSDDPTCPHLEQVVPKGKGKDKTKAKVLSWLTDDGVCSHCGGKAVADSRTPTGYRRYFLPDIERLVYAYLGNGAISPAQAILANDLVQTLAKIHGLRA